LARCSAYGGAALPRRYVSRWGEGRSLCLRAPSARPPLHVTRSVGRGPSPNATSTAAPVSHAAGVAQERRSIGARISNQRNAGTPAADTGALTWPPLARVTPRRSTLPPAVTGFAPTNTKAMTQGAVPLFTQLTMWLRRLKGASGTCGDTGATMIKCSLCGREFSGLGHNSYPLNNLRCCESCHAQGCNPVCKGRNPIASGDRIPAPHSD